jgi:hypothetical protein
MADGKKSLWKVYITVDHQDYIRNIIAETIVEAANIAMEKFVADFPSHTPLNLSIFTKIECLGTED